MQLEQFSKVMQLIYGLFLLCERVTVIPLLISVLEASFGILDVLRPVTVPAILVVPLGKESSYTSSFQKKRVHTHTHVCIITPCTTVKHLQAYFETASILLFYIRKYT